MEGDQTSDGNLNKLAAPCANETRTWDWARQAPWQGVLLVLPRCSAVGIKACCISSKETQQLQGPAVNHAVKENTRKQTVIYPSWNEKWPTFIFAWALHAQVETLFAKSQSTLNLFYFYFSLLTESHYLPCAKWNSWHQPKPSIAAQMRLLLLPYYTRHRLPCPSFITC